MSLDVLTPKGQKTREQEEVMIAAFCSACPGYKIIQTPKDEPADIDALITFDSAIVGIAEHKCRNMSKGDLLRFGNEWLLTYDKIVKGCDIAKALKVPFYGFLYLIDDSLILSVKIADKDGHIIQKVRIERTETQAAVNGGTAIRTNAYIDMSGAREIRVEQDH